MSGLNNSSQWTNHDRRSRFGGLDVSAWALLAAGATLAIAVINFTIVRPTTWQLGQLRRQVAQLELQIDELAGKRNEVARTNTLLGQLVEQDRRREEAGRSLDEITDLHARLNRQTGQVERALRTLEKLGALQDSLVADDSRVDEAASVLTSMETLADRINGRQYDTVQSHLAVDALDRLRGRLQETHCLIPGAVDSVEAIDALQARIARAAESTFSADQTLDAMVDLGDRLIGQGGSIELARGRVEQLIDLKDRTLDRTADLAGAAENLELLLDVKDQLEKVALSFNRMRHWIVEIVAFEPTFARAMRSLQPLIELGNLRHMSATDLRQVIRTLGDRRGSELVNSPNPEATQPAIDGVSTLPASQTTTAEDADLSAPVAESARAN